jgi:hypothetical protein
MEFDTIDWTNELKKERNRQKRQTLISQKTISDLKSFLVILTIPIMASLVSFYINMIEVLLEQTSDGCFYGKCLELGQAKEIWFMLSRLLFAYISAVLCEREE